MALHTKIIGGLAWVGLAVVLAVPSADILSSQLSPNSPFQMTADTDQIQTGSIADPVKTFVETGKPMPSYISDAPAPVATVAAPKPTVKVIAPSGSTPSPVTFAPITAMPPVETDVAAIAPVPYPASMRPKAPVVSAPIVTDPVVSEPVIVDEPQVATVEHRRVPRPPAAVEEPRDITEDQLADWDSGSLADYLERQNLIADAGYQDDSSAEYDSDGFFLDEGPNNRTIHARSRSRRNADDGFFLFGN